MARPPIQPGEIFADELKELGVTPTKLHQVSAAPVGNRCSAMCGGIYPYFVIASSLSIELAT